MLETWVEGERVYDATDPDHARYVDGGFGVFPAAGNHVHDGCWR